MALYEHVYLMRPDATTQQVEVLTARLVSILESLGGKVSKTEYWGLKPLAYRMNKHRKAHFSLLNIEASPEAVAEMERQMRHNEEILRFLTLSVPAHEEEPSAMMRKREEPDREREERGGSDSRRSSGHPGSGGRSRHERHEASASSHASF